ncbi:LPS assembly protein LptD [Alteromonas sp. a30]|nr:LPS assembly protein LptD [Alteromonas sp. a30]
MYYNHLIRIPLFFGIALPIAAQEQCLAPLKPFENNGLANGDKIVVQAEKVEIKQDTIAEFNGKVAISNRNALINAERALINKDSQELSAEGNIQYSDPSIQIDSDNVDLDINDNRLQLDNTLYQLRGLPGRGKAERIVLSEENGVELQDVSFSSCPVGAEDWHIQASAIELKPGSLWGTAKHTRFYIKDVPVFYLPYFAFPVTEQRQSGLLFPQISSNNRTGLSYEQPIYWNILPNIDMTFSPRYMTRRGLQLKTELRYLTPLHTGEMHLEYLNNDQEDENLDERYFYRFSHKGYLDENWSVHAEWNDLSDDNYITDLGSDFYNRADTHLFKTLGMNYHSDDLFFSAKFRDFETIGDHPDSYRSLPELKLQYKAWESGLNQLQINSEVSYFDNNEEDAPSATRIHIAPKLSLPYRTSWAEFLAETSLLHTEYFQDNIEGELDSHASRTLAQVRLYGSMSLERPASWFGQQVTQTLEPKFQYHYTSYEDQNDIGLYDTTRLLNDVVGIFRGQEFTGLDRISDTNQIALGVTSRILDKNNREQFRLGLGQIFYFDDNRVLEASKESNRSAIAAELDWNISSKWTINTEIQVSSRSEKVERSNIALEYRLGANKLLQLNHRYIRDISGDEIDQLGVTASWPITHNWQWVGRYYRDMDLNRSTESFIGIQYESCCWGMQLVWQRHLSNRFDALGNQSFNAYDSGINFKFVFKGMGSGKSSRTLLDEGLYGYRRPYFLSN